MSETIDPLFNNRDLPERLGPMTVKELRQGLRRGMFVFPFLGIHVLAVVAMVAEFTTDIGEVTTEHTGTLNLLLFTPAMWSGWFWLVTGFVCLLLMPLGGLALMGQELDEGNHELLLMTPLSRWKVVRGKFLALWGLCLLTFSSLLPYVIVRYFIGGIDVPRNIMLALTVVLFSAMMASGAIGASSYTKIFSRICILVLFSGSMLASLAIVLAAAGSRDVGVFMWHFNAFAAAFCYIVFGLALARSRIRLVVHHYEVKPSWMMIGLLFFTPFVVMMVTAMTMFYAGGIGLIGMGIVGWFADVSPKAPKWVQSPLPNVPGQPGAVILPPVAPSQTEPPLRPSVSGGPPPSGPIPPTPPPLPSSVRKDADPERDEV